MLNASAAAISVPPPDPGLAVQRLKLVGMASSGSIGMALIELDGLPARSYRVGDDLGGNLVLREISAQGVVVGPRDGGAAIELRTPPPQAVNSQSSTDSNPPPGLDLSDGSVESQRALQKMGAKNAPQKPPSAAEQASAAQASVPTDPGRWRPAGQP